MDDKDKFGIRGARRLKSFGSQRRSGDAGDFDSAASRSYYAMYHAAEALLAALGQKFKTHQGLISAYGLEFAKSGELPTELHR